MQIYVNVYGAFIVLNPFESADYLLPLSFHLSINLLLELCVCVCFIPPFSMFMHSEANLLGK